MAHTPGEWKLANDAQGPCMVMHPDRRGVAIACLSNTHQPAKGFHDDWFVQKPDGSLDRDATAAMIAERNANARLIAAAPKLLESLKKMMALAKELDESVDTGDDWRIEDDPNYQEAVAVIAKAEGTPVDD
jgi:hypothetical protein